MIPTKNNARPGVTASERYLARLCERSFLRLWSHPNLYKKQNDELCDLLVVFGDDIIVFSDKSCKFDPGPQGWSRWYRRAVLNSAKQLNRAASWLTKHPGEVYLDAKREHRFPLALPAKPRIHLIAVAVGIADACREHFKGGSGSLRIAPESDGTEPFTIGDIDRSRAFVHVFDEISLDLVMHELDTIDDFIRYLTAKAAFARSGRLVSATGEEDLLGYYLSHMNDSAGAHGFVFDGDPDCVAIGEHWQSVVKRGEYRRKKHADAISYVWDRMVDSIADSAMGGTLVAGQERPLRDLEEGLRLLAAENRLARRVLSKAVDQVLEGGKYRDIFARTMPATGATGHSYLFMSFRRDPRFRSEEIYRQARQLALQDYAETIKLRYADTKVLVGLAFGPESGDGSIDLLVVDFEKWTADDAHQAEETRRARRWSDGSDLAEVRFQELEYPDVEGSRTKSQAPERTGGAKRDKRKAQRAARRKNRK